MKKINATLFLIFFFSAVFAQQYTKKNLVGQWEGKDSQNTKASILFLDTDKVVVAIGGNTMPPYTYTIDLPKNPAKLDIKMLGPNGQTATLLGFLLIVDSNTIKWQIFPRGNRGSAYDENSTDGPVITLKKVK